MKIDRLISSCNENITYLSFLAVTSKAWYKILGKKIDLAFISDRDENDQLISKMKEFVNVHVFKPVLGIDSGVQSKISRMILASDDTFRDENCMIIDIDMIPLNKSVIDVFDNSPSDHLVKWGWDHPSFSYGTPDFGKWPMDRTSASGKIFKEIVNPENLSYTDLIDSWKNFHLFGKEAVNLPFSVFSDESLLRALYEKWGNKEKTYRIARSTIEKEMMGGRIDRSKALDPMIREKLKTGEYFECHGMRPFHENIRFYQEIIEFLGLSEEELDWMK